MKKYLALSSIIFIIIAISCKKETASLPDNPVISYKVADISTTNGYQVQFKIDNFNADLNLLYLWDLGTGKFYQSTTPFNKVYSQTETLLGSFPTLGPHHIKLTAINENGETVNNFTFTIKPTDTIANFQGTITSTYYIIKRCVFYAKPNSAYYYNEIYTCNGNNLHTFNYNFSLNLNNNGVILPIYGNEYDIFVEVYYDNYSYANSDNESFYLHASNTINFSGIY
jgi:hypothetical protein